LGGRIEKLRLLIAIPFILIGSILTATTIEDISYLGNITIKIKDPVAVIPIIKHHPSPIIKCRVRTVLSFHYLFSSR
jgi:hypothetical protein